MILVDSNVPMYLVGAPHPHKLDAQRLLESALSAGERLVTDAEVLQEICHRYVAINRREAIQPAIDVITGIVDEVLAIEKRDVMRAAEILRNRSMLSARDAIHIAIMERYRITSIISFDADFDQWPGLRRIHRI